MNFNWFKKKVSYKYFIVDITYRAVYEQSDKGGMRITVRFEKTIERFGKSKTYSQEVTFNNYHTRDKDGFGERLFTYNPPYIPGPNAHSEDSFWHSIWIWKNCEEYAFAPINTRQLNLWIDDWDKTVTHFICPICEFKQTTKKENKTVNCPSCNKRVGVPS